MSQGFFFTVIIKTPFLSGLVSLVCVSGFGLSLLSIYGFLLLSIYYELAITVLHTLSK